MEPGPETRSLSPGRAFAVVTVVLLAIGATWYFAAGDSEPTPRPTPIADANPADFSLTDEEAIARFKELDQLRLAAYGSTDVSLVRAFLTDGSPLTKRVHREITRLKRDLTRPQIKSETLKLSVTHNNSSEIRVKQVVIWDVRFFRGGKDVTEGGGREKQVVRWILRRDPEWLLHDATVVSARPLRR